MPTLTENQSDIYASLSGVITDIHAAQLYHKNNSGGYIQLKRSHSSVPQDAVAEDTDGGSDKPDDVGLTFDNFFIEAGRIPPTSLKASIACDVYGSGDSSGYVIRIMAIIDGIAYCRHINFGCDTAKAKGWCASGN